MTKLSTEVKAINNEISEKHGKLLSKNKQLRDWVSEQASEWKSTVKRYLDVNNPFYDEKHKTFLNNENSFDITNFNLLLKDYKQIAYENKKQVSSFWDKEDSKFKKIAKGQDIQKECINDLNNSFTLLHKEREKVVEQLYNAWELQKIAELRSEFIKQLLEKLHEIEKLYDYVETLGLDPGLFLDFSSGSLTALPFDDIKKWLEYLKNDKGVQSLIDVMGRINLAKQSEKIEQINQTFSEEVIIPDINSKEEIVGITLGKDIENALPSELALMANPDTSILFDLKYIESNLLCFDLEGTQVKNNEYEVEVETTVLEDETKGPLIICVDTSGSMHGAPETIAKAVTLLMTSKAKQNNRSCYLINFSTGISTLDLSNDFNMERLMSFLKMSFYGGTDVAPAIKHGLTLMESDSYKDADMLIISDFVMADLPKEIINDMEELRGKGNKFNSLVVDNSFMEHRLRSIFDHEWVYNPNTSSVSELLGFEKNVYAELTGIEK